MTTESDRLLVQQLRSSDPAVRDPAWKLLFDRYNGRVRAYIRRRLIDGSVTEDAVQDTFVGFMTSLANFDDKRDMQSWLFSIAAYKVIDQLRKKGRLPHQSDGDGTDEPLSQERDEKQRHASSLYRSQEQRNIEADAVARALREIVRGIQQSHDYPRLKVLELLFVAGWKNQRVAEALKLPEQTVANWKFDAVRKLKEAMQNANLPPDVFPELLEAA